MQRLKISHRTVYQYSCWVTLGPHRLLIRPREGHDVRIESSRLDVTPACSIRWHRDVFDNSVAVVNFREAAARLEIASEVVIQHFELAPLDFIVEQYAVDYPFQYQPHERADLAAYQQPLYSHDAPVVRAWLDRFGAGRAPLQTYVLLDRMNRAIRDEFSYAVREEAGVQSPALTLQERRGSCRDYATLMLEACRQLGLASRFVSGYLHAPATEAGNAATHAWVEVYLPGPGWKGFDPTVGELAGSRHIPVAVARDPGAVSPVAGSFTGPGGEAPTLAVDVRVTEL